VPLLPLIAAIAAAVIGSLFALADTAVTTLSSARLQALLEQATGPTKRAYERIRDADAKLRTRYVLGRVAATAITGVFLHEVFQVSFPRAAPWLAIVTTSLLNGTLFEITTTLGRKHADRVAPACARYLRLFEVVLLPLAVPLAWLAEYLNRKESEVPNDPKVVEAEVEIMVEEVERSGLFGAEPAEMIRNVLEFADRTARDVMIPRSKVEAIDISTPIDQVLTYVTESGHSRYPVYKEQLDNIVGLLYAKDLFKVTAPMTLPPPSMGGTIMVAPQIKEIIRAPANFVAESQPLSSLLREMRGRRQHLAVVVDEFGGMSGIVTLEDVLEEIVGDIRDEHDEAPAPGEPDEGPIQDLGDGRLVADADVSMRDLSAYLGTDLPSEGPRGGGSLGLMLTEHVGHVPEAGTEIEKYGLQFIVRDADDKHIGKVEIVRPGRDRQDSGAAQA
jgi:CBS domain containing-hemolysin-like protein